MWHRLISILFLVACTSFTTIEEAFPFFDADLSEGRAIALAPIKTGDPLMRYADTTYTVLTQDGKRLFYQHIFTPVCMDNVCLPVYITLYWDILGNYHSYRVSKDSPLTKIGHAPFTKEDYHKLDRVLADAYSILGSYSQEELKQLVEDDKKPKKEKIDGMSGATWQTGESLVIDGALYTCHTLWKLTNGPIQQQILAYTKKHLLDRDLMKKCLRSEHDAFKRFAIEQLASFPTDAMYSEVLPIVLGQDADMSYWLLYQLPSTYYTFDLFTLSLIDHFNELSRYDVKVACLKKLRENKALSDGSMKALIAKGYAIDPSLLTNLLYVLCKQTAISNENKKLALDLVKEKKAVLQEDRFFTRAFQYDTFEMNALYEKINKLFPK